MLRLQQKAHVSIDEFRKGKGTPTSKYHNHTAPEISPAGEEDELSVLGGKTRLVSKKEALSPIFTQRSPISQTPVVPLPISPGMLPPSVRDYLDSFKPRVNGVQQQDASTFATQQFGQRSTSLGNGSFDSIQLTPQEQTRPTFSSADMAQSPFYSPSTAFGGDPLSSYQQQRAMMPPPPRQNLEIDTGVREADLGFPQYLPVYDYTLASTSYVNGSGSTTADTAAMYGTDSSMMMLDTTNQSGSSSHSVRQYHQQRRLSDSPDGNMQTTWDDFVNSMGCVGVIGQ